MSNSILTDKEDLFLLKLYKEAGEELASDGAIIPMCVIKAARGTHVEPVNGISPGQSVAIGFNRNSEGPALKAIHEITTAVDCQFAVTVSTNNGSADNRLDALLKDGVAPPIEESVVLTAYKYNTQGKLVSHKYVGKVTRADNKATLAEAPEVLVEGIESMLGKLTPIPLFQWYNGN